MSEILKGFAHVLVLSDYYLAAKLPRKKSVCQFKPSVMCSLSINRSLCVSSPHLMVISLIQQSLRGQREGRRKYSPERSGFLQALTLRLLTLPTHKSSLSPPIFQTRPQPISCLLSSTPLSSLNCLTLLVFSHAHPSPSSSRSPFPRVHGRLK